jgi:hypothetical protein
MTNYELIAVVLIFAVLVLGRAAGQREAWIRYFELQATRVAADKK